jgi:hypothetical protein
LQALSLAWGVFAVLGMVIAILPCLGALNWVNLPFAGLGIIVGGIAYANAEQGDRGASTAGLVLCVAAIVIGLMRLGLGGGVL